MKPQVDGVYLIELLRRLLEIPSPTGYTDNIVHFLCDELEELGVAYELTRRGAIRANLPGRDQDRPDRALVAHVDSLGAMVREIRPDGRLRVAAIGTWSALFAQGARVTIFCDAGHHRGTILPLKSSGHVYHREIDEQPIDWDHLEIRVDAAITSAAMAMEAGIHVGDIVAIDPAPEITDTGFIVSRHLDNKAGVACLMAAARSVLKDSQTLPLPCHLLFTISEEVGSGASAVLHQDVAEMVSIDNALPAPGQNSQENQVTIAMMDSSGPFDYHLTRRLLELAHEHDIPHSRDVFRNYYCDAASAVEAGNDIRTALACFGVDSSHGYERTHLDSLLALTRLMIHYMHSEPLFTRDRLSLGPIQGFPELPLEAPPVPQRRVPARKQRRKRS